MKRLVLMIIPALICGVAFTGCNAEKAEAEFITSNGLYVIGTKSGISPTNMTDLVFTGDDIVYFFPHGALETRGAGEIVFTEEKTAEIISRARLYSDLHFFIDGKPVFSVSIKIWFVQEPIGDELDLLFLISTNGRFQIIDPSEFMHIHWVDEKSALEFAAKMQKRKKELEVLIDYLSDAGKTVDI